MGTIGGFRGMGRRTSISIVVVLGVVAVAAVGVPALWRGGSAAGQRLGEPAPELAGGRWINSPPLTIGALRGRVVLVEFWTYG